MRALVITGGGYGDTIPFVALASGLRERGHAVSLVVVSLTADTEFSKTAEQFGLDLHEIGLSQRELDELQSDSFDAKSKRTFMSKLYGRYHDKIAVTCMHMRKHVDVVVFHYPAILGDEFANYLRAVGVPVCLQPFYVPTKSFPSPAGPPLLSYFSNYLSYLYPAVFFKRPHNYAKRHRKYILSRSHTPLFRNFIRHPARTDSPVIQAFSKHVIPDASHYREGVHTTNFWFLNRPPGWQPPQKLVEFLECGTIPVCIEFGSTLSGHSRQDSNYIVEAVRRAGVRAVLIGGLGGIDETESCEGILFVKDVPFSWLFPKVSAIVHHGGIGSSSLALAAGKPQVILPFTGEQAYFAERMFSLGVACDPLPQNAISPERLAEAICYATSSHTITAKAQRIAYEVNESDGTKNAVEVLEALIAQR